MTEQASQLAAYAMLENSVNRIRTSSTVLSPSPVFEREVTCSSPPTPREVSLASSLTRMRKSA